MTMPPPPGPDFSQVPPPPGQAPFASTEHGSYTFGEAIASGFKKYANFKGRARRSEYWFFWLFTFLVTFPPQMVVNYSSFTIDTGNGMPAATYPLALGFLSIVGLGLFIPSLAVAVRRLHDTGTSGAYLFFGLIPVVGAILILIKLASEGTNGTNAYGASD